MAAMVMVVAVVVLISLTEDSNRQLKIFWQLEILWVEVLSVMAVARPGVISSGSEPFLKTMAGLRALMLLLEEEEDQEE